MSNETNPPAFPHSRLGSDCDGMSLRDYFAAKAMQGLCANTEFAIFSEITYADIANIAYMQADEMLKARSTN